MTSSASKKRRRRREREKRTQELLQRARTISLVDVASPPPKAFPKQTSSKVPLLSQSLKRNGSPVVVDNKSASSSKNNLSQEPSWKRVDFVLPRADGKKLFVFDRQIKQESDKMLLPQENIEGVDEKLKEYRKFETIEDILFAGKRKKESSPPKNLDVSSDQDDEGRGRKINLHDKNETIISESRRKKLEDAFEAAQQPENTLAIGNYVNIPKTSEQNDSHHKTSSPQDQRKDSAKSKEAGQDSNETLNHKKTSTPIHTNPPSPGQISGRTVKEAVRDKRGLRPRANSTDGELNLPRGGLCDERMILEAHKWNAGRKVMTQSPPRGFHNLGNTCFLNATLQCLAYLPPLCQTLVDLSNNKTCYDQNGGKRKMPQGQRITSSLCNLFQQAHSLKNGSSKTGGPFAPKKVVSHLPNIGSCGSRNGSKFRLGRQEDAHEFLVHLLDSINDGELRAAGINQTVSGWRDRLPVSRLDETTFVHRIFGGYFRSQIRCRKCNYKSNTYDPFLDLSLEVSKKSSTSVLRALSEFTRKETLDAANQWKCSGCKKYVCATKQLTVFRPPLTLCIQLKRFAFDNCGFGQKFSKYHHGYGGGGGGGGSKITKPIEFPGSLHLPLSDNRSCQYTLTGVVIHVGGSSQSGHYTAYVKKPGKNGASQWYHMDDSHVQPVSERTVLKQKDAYLLFYCRTEVKLEFPDPPSRSMSASEATEFGRTRAIARTKSLPSESLKKELMGLGMGRSVEENRVASFSNEKLSNTQQLSAVPSTKKEQKQTLQRVKTTIHPLGDTLSPQAAYGQNRSLAGASNSKDIESEAGSSSPSSSSDEDLAESRRTKNIIGKNENIPANNNTDTSSDDSSYNESSADSNSNSDSDSSSQIDSPPSDISNKKPIKKKSEEAGSSESETDSEIGSSSNDNETKSKQNDQDDGTQNSSIQNPTLEDGVGSLGKASPSNEEKIQGLGKKYMSSPAQGSGKKYKSSPVQSSEQPKDSSESDAAESDSEGEEKKSQNGRQNKSVDQSPLKHTSTTPKRPQQLVLNNSDSRGKVKVMLGPRKRKAWESIVSTLPSKGSNFHLLGNRKVSQWNDDDDDDNDGNEKNVEATNRKRKRIVENFDKQNRKRKRKMHLDRWDSHLDQGRLKKVKSKSDAAPHETSSRAPKKNVFQRIQSGVQKMNRGKPKGGFRRFNKNRKGSF